MNIQFGYVNEASKSNVNKKMRHSLQKHFIVSRGGGFCLFKSKLLPFSNNKCSLWKLRFKLTQCLNNCKAKSVKVSFATQIKFPNIIIWCMSFKGKLIWGHNLYTSMDTYH